MCIDFRKSLSIPRDWAFILRREGANMDGAEFAIALALSKGVRHMALIAHNSCAMSNTAHHRDAFVTVLCEKYNWKRPQAVEFFDNHARSHDIGNEIDFVLQEAQRLSSLFPGLTVVPILFRVEDDRLYLIYDWLIANAKDDAIMRKLTLRDTGGFRTIKS
jgi:carbonic anhydrase